MSDVKLEKAHLFSDYREEGYDDEEEVNDSPRVSTKLRAFKEKRRYLLTILVTLSVLLACGLFLITFQYTRPIQSSSNWDIYTPQRTILPNDYSGKFTQNPVNSTLGFEKIIVLHLPSRLDKKDELLLMAEVAGIELTFLPTHRLSDLSPNGLPWHETFKGESKNTMGVYRAHLDAAALVLEKGWNSALIMEDDVDWDIRLREILQRFQQPFATLINSWANTSDAAPIIRSTESDPWMSKEWDLINFGTCIEDNIKGQDRFDVEHPPFIMYDDDSLPEYSSVINTEKYHTDILPHEWVLGPMNKYNVTLPGDTERIAKGHKVRRMAMVNYKAVCLSAYALSRQGAARVLYQASREMIIPIDDAVVEMSVHRTIRSYEVLPPFFTQWKVQDGMRNSDKMIDNGAAEIHENKGNHNPSIGYAEFIKDSLRASMANTLGRQLTEWGIWTGESKGRRRGLGRR